MSRTVFRIQLEKKDETDSGKEKEQAERCETEIVSVSEGDAVLLADADEHERGKSTARGDEGADVAGEDTGIDVVEVRRLCGIEDVSEEQGHRNVVDEIGAEGACHAIGERFQGWRFDSIEQLSDLGQERRLVEGGDDDEHGSQKRDELIGERFQRLGDIESIFLFQETIGDRDQKVEEGETECDEIHLDGDDVAQDEKDCRPAQGDETDGKEELVLNRLFFDGRIDPVLQLLAEDQEQKAVEKDHHQEGDRSELLEIVEIADVEEGPEIKI